jgi:hypothetical protein
MVFMLIGGGNGRNYPVQPLEKASELRLDFGENSPQLVDNRVAAR